MSVSWPAFGILASTCFPFRSALAFEVWLPVFVWPRLGDCNSVVRLTAHSPVNDRPPPGSDMDFTCVSRSFFPQITLSSASSKGIILCVDRVAAGVANRAGMRDCKRGKSLVVR
ncbi:uncharacterized protein SPPG_09031 [Spizellomyces punctatus DAOM BR117]|uniref:Secreted protein n=1 Tax=Spizellomyces punctatus (strain DAOM BR117) TaxID=645134 RepID=A0A0L0HLS7_SPIPD|nr:uncharacterized protein SPPG_09031 [Spizellomyces punctatus DAOM BR117]KND02018.1 hypothetical protein SPPG_09031 [Spizellomyces punctatus DAOM BR117]|eukprot:XP_016610057.1 hypothetical protein SPPG_09031 [Spizellomyces punctatus DAOM BR117]